MKKVIQLAFVGMTVLAACKKTETVPAVQQSVEKVSATPQPYTARSLKNATANTYCTSKGNNTTRGYINKVSIETINNLSGNNGGYGDFTSQSVNLEKAATYSIELTPGFIQGAAYFEYWTVYIDYNHDGIFEANEIVAKGNAAIKIIKSFKIPTTAANGPTRMRIQMQEGAQKTDPCAIYTYGEVEDYTVNIATSL
jgi:bacillolysin